MSWRACILSTAGFGVGMPEGGVFLPVETPPTQKLMVDISDVLPKCEIRFCDRGVSPSSNH